MALNGEPRTLYQVGQETIRLFDTAGGTNPLTALAHQPGIKVATVDAYGLNNTRGGQKGIRVRGEVSTHGMLGTVDGVALVVNVTSGTVITALDGQSGNVFTNIDGAVIV